MNITITWTQGQYIFNTAKVFWFLILFTICLICLGSIIGAFSGLIARYIDKTTLKNDIISIDIGDNGEKFLLTNASDIEWVRSYMIDMPDRENVKYIFNYYRDQAYKVIGGEDLIPIDHYDADI